ncbi:MAG TPA: VOC family protein [Candidatus Thermoplasmatota archaeon]
MAPRRRRPTAERPLRTDLGRVDFCLNVRSIARSREFYGTLGFRKVGGNIERKWLIMKRGEFRLGLFQGYIDENLVNFRGGHVGRIVEGLGERGLKPYNVRKLAPDGSGSALLKDPDGNVLFFDSTPRERVWRRKSRGRGDRLAPPR